jgi:predicted nucleic acid-binding protein
MIVVDTTVWIDYFNGIKNPQTDCLDKLIAEEQLLIGDIILGEVLQGFRSDDDFETARLALSHLPQAPMLNPTLAIRSARNYRILRKLGITVRKTIDCFIATYCIEFDHQLLHNDRDFDPFESHLGLQVIHPEQQ